MSQIGWFKHPEVNSHSYGAWESMIKCQQGGFLVRPPLGLQTAAFRVLTWPHLYAHPLLVSLLPSSKNTSPAELRTHAYDLT